MVTWQYALSDDGSLKNISDVTDAYRKVHNFTCFGCDKELFAIRGSKKERHFRHAPSCVCNPETYLHQLGKKMFTEFFDKVKAQNKRLLVDFLQTKICVNPDCPLGKDHCVENVGEYEEFELFPHFNHYEVEKYDPDTGLTPDILLTNDDGEKVYIEIFVNHPSSEEKIKSNIPIVEISLSEESDLKCLQPELNDDDIKIDNSFTECFNIPNSKKLAEKPICLKSLDKARQHFLDYFRYYQQNEQPVELVYSCTKICESKKCPHLEKGRCVKPTGFDRFDLAEMFNTFIKEDKAENFSQDLIISNGKKAKIRFRFGLRLSETCEYGDDGRVVQYAINLDSDTYPWQECSVIQEGPKVRFFNFEKKNELDCKSQFFYAVVIYKNGRCMPLSEHRITNIKEKILKQKQAIVDYILIPTSRLEQELGFPTYKEQFKAAISVFKLKKLDVRNCFLCKYSGDNSYSWDDESKPIFCKTFRFPCSSGQAVGCERYRIKYDAVQEHLNNEGLKRLLFECFETYRIK